jgi:uncharacterized membrane protein YfcA
MTGLEAVAVTAAGVAAGTINTVVGSGTLVTFPVLLAVGYSPVVANVSNNVGLVPGSLSGTIGYRRELAGQRDRIRRFAPMSVLGAAVGAAALLILPAAAFKAIVPVFLAIALVVFVVSPHLQRAVGAHRPADAEHHGLVWRLVVFLTGVYGGYFGAAQGIMLLAVLELALPDDLHRINALKNVLAGLVNLVAGLIFIVVADVAWEAAGLIALGSVVGGQLGARYGRRLPSGVLRGAVVVVGVVAIVRLLAT